MKISFPPVTIEDFSTLKKWVGSFLNTLGNLINKNISLSDNIKVSEVSVSFGSANETTVVSHGLGVTPIMYVPNINSNGGGVIYDVDRSSWDDTRITVACTATGVTARLFIFS